MSMLKLQIIRAEGENWDNSVLGCYISFNSELLDVITPLNSQHESNQIKVPTRGSLKLYIKTMGDSSKFLGNVALPLEILPNKGYVWLPLISSINENFIDKIPEDIQGAKILLSINDEVKVEVAKQEIPSVINQELSLQLSQMQGMIKQETLTRKEIQKNYAELLETHKKSCLSSDAREMSLIRLLEQKDQEIQSLRNSLEKVEAENKNFEFERENLNRKIEELKSFDVSQVFGRLSEELEETKRMFQESIKQRNFLWSQLGGGDFEGLSFGTSDQDRKFIGLKAEIIKYDEENKHLRIKLLQSEKIRENLSSQVFDLQQACELAKSEGKDHSLKFTSVDSSLAQQGFLNLFKKLSCCYGIGEKIVQILSDDGKLTVKYLGQCFGIEEFVKFYVNGEELRGSRKNSARMYKTENSESERSKKGHTVSSEVKVKKSAMLRERNRETSVENRFC